MKDNAPLQGWELIQNFGRSLRSVGGWRVSVEKPGTLDETWTVSTIEMDADYDGRPCDYGVSVLEGVVPVMEDEGDMEQVQRALQSLPEALGLLAHFAALHPESGGGKIATSILDYIVRGEVAYYPPEDPEEDR